MGLRYSLHTVDSAEQNKKNVTCCFSLVCISSFSTSRLSFVIFFFCSLRLKCRLVFLLSIKLASILQSSCSDLHFCTNTLNDLSSASRVRLSKCGVTFPYSKRMNKTFKFQVKQFDSTFIVIKVQHMNSRYVLI